MNKQIDFSQLDGIDLSQDLLQFMQVGYEGMGKALAALLGNKVIITGCEVAGPNITSGLIVYNDEVLPLIGGFAAPFVDIEIVTGTELFGDGSSRPVTATRQLRLVSSATVTSIPFADLVRPGQYQNLWQKGDTKTVLCDNAYIAANFDLATGIALPGSARAGWKIAFDMGGRVMIGWSKFSADPGDGIWDIKYNAMQDIGGEKLHALIANENAPHTHTYNRVRTDIVGAAIEANTIKNGNDRGLHAGDSINTSSSGLGDGHNNVQPYKVYLFIEKI